MIHPIKAFKEMGIPYKFQAVQSRFLLFEVLAISSIFPLSLPAFGASVEGHLRTVIDSTWVKLRDEHTASDKIRSSFLSSNLDISLTQLNDNSDVFITSIRDRYDFFTESDRQNLKLENKNSALLNEFAYQRPWQYNRIYFTIGRFELADAGIYRHDGLEFGYRLNEFQRISLFGGRAPKDVWVPAARRADDYETHRQEQGLYWVYENVEADSDESVYMVNALAQAPSDDWTQYDRRTYIYHSSMFRLGTRHRFSNQINLDLTPISIIRQGYLTYQYLDAILQLTSFYNRISADDYRLTREIQDRLRPSKIDSIGLNLIQKVRQDVSLEYKLEASRRSVDALQRKIAAIGSRYQGLSQGRVVLGALAGIRHDFLSKDNFLQIQLDTFHRHTSFHFEQEYSKRKYTDTDVHLNQTRSLAELSFYFNEQWQGSTGWSMTHHSRADINTFYLMIGYIFSGQQTAPPPGVSADSKSW